MSFLELLRAYTLREYAVVLSMAVLGGLGLVFMLNSVSGGAPAGETLLKREAVARKDTPSLRYVEENAAARARAKVAALRQARLLAQRRDVARRAGRRATAAQARRPAATTTVTRTTPSALTPVPTRVVNPAPSQPVARPQPAPKPTPQKSESNGGGGGAFDDSG